MATIKCSFCGRLVSEVKQLISSPNGRESAYICNECVGVCASILRDDRSGAHPGGEFTVMAPRRNWLARRLAPKWRDSSR
jgi:ATP-dependent protease Clp ATPase subunit